MKQILKVKNWKNQRKKHTHRQGSLRIVLLFVLACAILSAFSMPVFADNSEDEKHVLFINSYGYDFETVPIVEKEISQRLSGVASVQYLFMNEKYISDEEASAQLSAELDVMVSLQFFIHSKR